MTPTLYLVCGLPAAGKTMRARELEAAGNAVRLTPDEWIAHLYTDDAEVAARDERRDRVERLQWQLTERLLKIGVDVVLDWGFWTRKERARYRQRGEILGAQVKIEFVNVPLDILQGRLAARNLNLPRGTFQVSAMEMEGFANLFEHPTAEEMSGQEDI